MFIYRALSIELYDNRAVSLVGKEHHPKNKKHPVVLVETTIDTT